MPALEIFEAIGYFVFGVVAIAGLLAVLAPHKGR